MLILLKKPPKFEDLPYSRVIIPDAETGTFTSYILEFPGCITQGNTIEEAYARLNEAAESWIEAAREMGQEIPKPLERAAWSTNTGGKHSIGYEVEMNWMTRDPKTPLGKRLTTIREEAISKGMEPKTPEQFGEGKEGRDGV